MDFEKTNLNLRAGDYEKLKIYADAQGLKASNVVRLLVSNLVDRLETEEVSLADVLGA